MMLWTPDAKDRRDLSTLDVDFIHQHDLCVITDSLEQTRTSLTTSGHETGVGRDGSVVEFSSSIPPGFDPDVWPLRRLRDFLKWLEQWDSNLHRAFLGRLESLWTKGRSFLVVIFSTPSGRFGLQFNVTYQDQAERNRLAKHPSDRRQRILRLNPTLTRFTVSDLSPTFVHGRNQSGRETLADKKITVVGCGTVGGYLATFLARVGAGSGSGLLTLFDPQNLGPENLGRHVLSIGDIYRNKAEGVSALLKKEFPHLNVRSRAVDATQATDTFEADVIVDATGACPISSALNAEHVTMLVRSERTPTLIYTWVEGPGDAARCLTVDSLKGMCYECQFVRSVNQRSCPTAWCTSRESWFGWTRAQLTTADNRVV